MNKNLACFSQGVNEFFCSKEKCKLLRICKSASTTDGYDAFGDVIEDMISHLELAADLSKEMEEAAPLPTIQFYQLVDLFEVAGGWNRPGF